MLNSEYQNHFQKKGIFLKMNNDRRVVVTGLGVITPLGCKIEKFWKSLINGDNGVSRISAFVPDDFPSQIAAEVHDFNPEMYMERKEVRRSDRFTQFAVAAAKEAITDARIEGTEDLERIGVIIGSGIGGIKTLEDGGQKLSNKGPRSISPFFIPSLIINIAAGQISINYGFRGPNLGVVSACSTGAHAIGESFRIITRREADIMIAGGTEAPITPLAIAGFSALKALSYRNDEPHRASRPFDKERNGFIMGEGAGVVVLEELEHALARNVHIYAELIGYGMSADAYHITASRPDGEGAIQSMKNALKDADISPREVDYINAHGTSTELNDKNETTAIKKVFGEYAYNIPINSTKSMTGHLLGAAGAVEFIVTILSLCDNIIHPTINYEFPDPDCDLNYVPNKAIEKKLRITLSNVFGFGGHNVTLIAKKYPDV